MRKFFLVLPLLSSLFFPKITHAQEKNQFITIVNPVRISRYTGDPEESIKSQYSVISDNELPATWLLTFEAMTDDGVFLVVDSMDEKQEIGIFLEVTPELAEAAGVEYHDTGFWHHATAVFLSGYSQEERTQLIDTVFNKFRELFGYYPTSVGSWWTDSFSLTYMKEKYGITANLGVADQFSTDGYQVWGQYWSTPFYPSKYHAGIPAADESVRLDVVTIQWAPRDPLNGYKSSLYSTQDYKVSPVNQETDYFEKLVRLYAGEGNNEFGQITIGLEGDLSPEAYQGEFKKQMGLVSQLVEEEEFKITNMKQFAGWYRNAFPKLSPPHFIESEDLLGEQVKKVFWYQSPRYRLGLVHDNEAGRTKVVDFRTYHRDIQEPYYQSPNREFELSIYIPSYFDEINSPEDVWEINLGELKTTEAENGRLVLDFEKGRILLSGEKFVIEAENIDVPKILTESLSLRTTLSDKSVEMVPKNDWIVGREGAFIKDLTPEATHFLATRRMKVLLAGGFIVFVSLSVLVIFSKISDRKKLIFLTLIILPPILVFHFWYQKNTTRYYISQGEIDALFRLSVLPEGKVLVYDDECLQCEYHIKYKPAAFVNKRAYIQKYGKHPIVYSSKVFEAKERKEAKSEFDKLKVKYLYLAKYEDYIEKIPFSPGDLGIEKIYDNANAEIWRVKE